jgi:hypothetical protein
MPTGQHDDPLRPQIRANRRRILEEILKAEDEFSQMFGMSKILTTPKLERQRLEPALDR